MTVTAIRDVAEPEGAWAQSAKVSFRFLYAAVCVLAIGWAISNFRQVPPDSRAVVLRFGSITRQQGAGLLMAWPKPIEQILLLPTADRQIQFEIQRFKPSGTNAPADFTLDSDPRGNTGFLLTGNSGVIHLQATLFYQINDPTQYVISTDHIAPALERLFIASAVGVTAGRDLDTILVARPEKEAAAQGDSLARREQLRADLVSAVNRRLTDLAGQGAGLGITVSRVDLVASLPSSAKEAFDLVLRNTQEAEQAIAQARTDAEKTSQSANQDHDRVLTEAQAAAEERTTQAKSRTAAINALMPQLHGPTGRALINKIYNDRIGALLKQAEQVTTFDPRGGTHFLLPGANQ